MKSIYEIVNQISAWPHETQVILESDYKADEPRVIYGYSIYGDHGYILFVDGRKIAVEQLDALWIRRKLPGEEREDRK